MAFSLLVFDSCNLLHAAEVPGPRKFTIELELNTGNSFEATTTEVSGHVERGPDGTLRATDRVAVNMKALKTGMSLRDKHLGEKLDTEKNPIAVATNIRSVSDDEGEAVLTYRGLKKNVKFGYEIKGDSVEVEFPMTLSELKLEEISFMGVSVEDKAKVKLVLPVVATSRAAKTQRVLQRGNKKK
jgi:hypothetical protein